jgi:hypothetical protein
VLRWFSLVALSCAACAREPSSGMAPKPSASPAAKKAVAVPKPAPNPAEAIAKLGPVVPETEQHQPPPSSKPLKTTGAIGDDLEGDASYFKLVAMRPCTDGKSAPPAGDGGAPDPKARTIVAAEVEIVAKSRVNVSPRDLTLRQGGIMFMASVDPKRELKGCTPLLKFSRLMPKESVKGFVLFDIPTWGPGSKLDELNLIYHPARFGGSIPVQVKLAAKS